MLTLLSLANKKAGALTDVDLENAAKSLAGDKADGLVSLFKTLRDAEPGVKVTDLLGTPTANTVLKSAVSRMQQASSEKDTGIFCRCPNCQFPFITE